MMFGILLFVFALFGLTILGTFINMVEGRDKVMNFLMIMALVVAETVIFCILFLGGYSI